MSLRRYLKDRLPEVGVTQAEVAEEFDINLTYVNQVLNETPRKWIRLHWIPWLAEAVREQPADLFRRMSPDELRSQLGSAADDAEILECVRLLLSVDRAGRARARKNLEQLVARQAKGKKGSR